MKLFFLLVVGSLIALSSAEEEILCDGATYDELRERQGGDKTMYDGCVNGLGKLHRRVGGGPTLEAQRGVISDEHFIVEKTALWWAFRPNTTTTVTDGVIIIPGGNVDSSSYSVLARNIAKGMLGLELLPFIAIPRYSSEVYAFDQCNVMSNDHSGKTIDQIRANYSDTSTNNLNVQVKNWVIGGHSEGAPAVNIYFNAQSPSSLETIAGGFMLGSYPSSTMQGLPPNIKFMSVMGGDNLGANLQTYSDAKLTLFPNNTIYHDFETDFQRGIHSYMGAYCPLTPGANGYGAELQYYELEPDSSLHPLEITRDKQYALVADWLTHLMSLSFL